MQDSSRPTHSIYQALSIYLYSCSISGSRMTWRTESLWLPYGGVTERAKILFSDQCYLQFDTPTKMSCFANPPLNLQATCQEVSPKSEEEFLPWSFLPCGCMWYQFRAIFSAGRAGGRAAPPRFLGSHATYSRSSSSRRRRRRRRWRTCGLHQSETPSGQVVPTTWRQQGTTTVPIW